MKRINRSSIFKGTRDNNWPKKISRLAKEIRKPHIREAFEESYDNPPETIRVKPKQKKDE